MNKRELQSEEQEKARIVRFRWDFDGGVGEEGASASFDFIGMQDNEIVVAAEKDGEISQGGPSCPNLSSDAQVLFSRSVEPATTLGIDEELDIVWSAWNAWQEKDVKAMDYILAAACEEILKNPFSPSQYHYLSCAFISKKIPEAFSFPKTYKMLLGLLNSGLSQSESSRPTLLPVFASKLLARAFFGQSEWPIEFIQAYLRDAVGPCVWIEHDSCKEFVANLSTAFRDTMVELSRSGDANAGRQEEPSGVSEVGWVQNLGREYGSVSVQGLIPRNKYSSDDMRKRVQTEYFIALSEVLEANSAKENPRALLKLLLIGVEYEDARLIGSSLLEGWINNPVHARAAKALLDCVVQKIHGMRESDINILGNLFLLKIKDQHNNIYRDMVTQLVRRRKDYATVALKTLVLVDLSAKNIANLKSMSTILRAVSVSPPLERELAMILQELAVNDDTRMSLRDFVCRMVRHIGSDINIQVLCQGLLQPWGAMANQNEPLKVAWLTEMVELVSAILLHSTADFTMDENIMAIVSPAETATLSGSMVSNMMASASKGKVEALAKFSLGLATLQLEAMAWCTDVVAVYVPNMNKVWFASILRQFLFLENSEAYFPEGRYFGELECKSLQLLGSCTSASEEILARVILMGISDVYPLTMGDALSIIESLVWRAAAFNKIFKGSLCAESKQLPVAVFKLASFNLPGLEEQSLLQLVYKDKYWRACLVVLLLAVYNPGTIGQYVWETNSTIRCMMEAVIMGRRTFAFLNDETSGKLKLSELESEAMICDAKAEEPIFAFLSDPKHVKETALEHMLLNINEWKGNVMLLDQFGSLIKPPGSIFEELGQADKVYQLGRELRECRHPDFFAKIICLQTLPKAWPWLKRIFCQEPELVSALPLSWQCEILYLEEGLIACGRKNFGDVQQLYLALCKVIMDKACEKEVKYVVEYLSCKLADKCGLVRSQARRCFAGLFHTVFVFWKEVSSSGDGDDSHFAKSGSFFHVANLERDETFSKCFKSVVPVTDYYNIRWLEGIEGLPNANVIFSSLLPAIQTAVQVETSVKVVSLYLKFLEKYSPRPPSVFSAACVIAKLFVQRKDFAACLLLRTRENDLHMLHPSSTALGEHISTEDIILNSLCEALMVGTSSVLNEDEVAGMKSPLVTVVSPQYGDGETGSFVYITLHKIVLDAVLSVLSLWSSEESKDTRKKESIEEMIQILLPNVTGKARVAWLKSGTRQQIPLLSEDQAIAFSRSTDERIASAGHNALSFHASVRLCKNLGIPYATVDFILDVFNSTAGVRLQELLNPKKEEENQALIFQACLQTLSKIVNRSFPNLSRLLIQFMLPGFSLMTSCTMAQSLVPDSSSMDGDGENCKNASTIEIIDCVIGHLANSDLKNNLDLLNGFSDLISANVQLRKHIQNELCYSSGFSHISFLKTSLRKFQGFGNHRLSWMHLSFFLLPALAVLIISNHYVPGKFQTSNVAKSNSGGEAQVEYRGYLQSIISQMEAELDNCLHGNNFARDAKMSTLLLHVKFIMAELVDLIEGTYEKSGFFSQKSVFKAMHANYPENFSHIDLGYLPMLGVEGTLCAFLQSKLKQVWSKNASYESQLAIFVWELMQFISCISREGCDYLKYVSSIGEDIEANFRKDILLLGCYGLISGFLKYLDVNMSSNDCTPFQSLNENAHVHSLTRLCLENVVHHSSLQVMVQVLKCMVETSSTMVTLPLTTVNNQGTSESLITYILSGFSLKEQVGPVSVLEFLHACCLQSQSVLPHRLSDQLEIQEQGNNVAGSLFTPSSAHFLAYLALQAFANAWTSKIVHHSFQEKPLLHIISQEDFLQAINKLVFSVLASGSIMSIFIQHLLSLDHDGICDSANEKSTGGRALHNAFSSGVKELLWTTYFAFPVSVSGISQSGIGNALFTNNTALGIKILHSSFFLFSRYDQAFPMYKIVQNALKIVCEGNEKESIAAYGFCHHIAKEYPLLLLPHVLTLAALLKEKMHLMNEGEDKGHSIGHALYLVAGLLDALRPHIFDISSSDQLWNNMQWSGLRERVLLTSSIYLCESDKFAMNVSKSQCFSKGGLEAILDIYFEFLEKLDEASLPQFLKPVISLADFLCYCAVAGNQCLDIVCRHQKLIQTATQKFVKIKKLGFLLSLIDNVDSSVNRSRNDTNELLSRQFQTKDTQLGPSMLPMDDVLKVQKKLQHFLSPQTDISDDCSLTYIEPETINQPERKLEVPNSRDEIDLLSTLNDIEKASARVPTILTYLGESLVSLTRIKNTKIQEIIYQLLERLLLHCPSEDNSRKVIEALLHNLKSSDISLAKVAARQAVKFFYHCPGLQETMLVELFLARSFAKEDLQQLLQDVLLMSSGH